MKAGRGTCALIREMLETPRVIAAFDLEGANRFLDRVLPADPILFTGEGSSRIFPAKHAVSRALTLGVRSKTHTEGCHPAEEINLQGWTVFGASNSGKTHELLLLFKELQRRNIRSVGVTTGPNTPLEKLGNHTFVLSCGAEKAVPASKAVIAEALFFDQVVHRTAGLSIAPFLPTLAGLSKDLLAADLAPEITGRCVRAGRIFFAGRNDGVAEELAIKSWEITRKLSVFLEGTLALHGIEEVLTPDDLLVWIDPFTAEEERFERVLRKGIGMPVIAVASRPTRFPTLLIPNAPGVEPYLQLMAGWNLLVHAGLKMGHDLDKPKRARKIGNEA